MSKFCMSCGLPVHEWVAGPGVYFEHGEYVKDAFRNEGYLQVHECPHCSYQQIDLVEQYGRITDEEDNEVGE